MRLAELLKTIPDVSVVGEEMKDVEILTLSADSRQKMQNGLFFCIKGENIDSHEYAKEAIKNGAIAIVTERRLEINAIQIIVKNSRESMGLISGAFFGFPAKRLKIIAITGTNGKTTTSYMLSSILEKANKKVGVIGTLGVCFANKKTASDLTTPDPIVLHRTFAEMLAYGVEYVVMEVSAHALYYQKTAGVEFTACIFSNLTQDHLDFFQTMQNYQETKMRLFSCENCSIAILNGDDEVGRAIGIMRTGDVLNNPTLQENCKTVFYGLNTPAEAFAVITHEDLTVSECVFNINDNLYRVHLAFTGRHNVYNALSAATCAMELGIENAAIEKGLSAIKSVSGRLENVGNYNGAEIYVDFAHTPDGLGKSLEALKQHCKGRLICLFGCGGNRDKSKRPLMGEIAARKADFSILTSDNPRYEDPLDIISEIERGYRRFSIKYVIVPDRRKALEYAVDFLKKGDILLVAGKGGEDYQEIMGIKYAFNDHDFIKKLLAEKK